MVYEGKLKLEELANEVNRWLKVRWEIAEHFHSLPTMQAVFNYAEKLFTAEVDRMRLSYFISDDKLGGTVPSPWAVHMMDMQLRLQKELIVIKTHILGDTEYSCLAAMKLNCEDMEMGDDKCRAVKSIAIEPWVANDVDVRTLAAQAAEHFKSAKLFERWEQAPESFKLKHLICPACGHAAHVYRFWNDNDQARYRVTCKICDWESSKVEAYQSDAIDAFVNGGFKRARNKVLHKEAAMSELNAVSKRISAGLDDFSSLCGKKANAGYYQEFAGRLALLDKQLNTIKESLEKGD